MELYNDTENCEAVNDALSPCILFVLFCLLMNLLVNLLMNLLVNFCHQNLSKYLFMNTFVFVRIYGGLRACLFLSLFTCLPIFILLSQHNVNIIK